MGSLQSAINDDIKDYLRLCEEYGEKPECGPPWGIGWYSINCYGAHADALKERARRELAAAPPPGPHNSGEGE